MGTPVAPAAFEAASSHTSPGDAADWALVFSPDRTAMVVRIILNFKGFTLMDQFLVIEFKPNPQILPRSERASIELAEPAISPN